MRVFLGLLVVYLLMNLGLIAIGIGIGFVLHWLLPAVDLGTSILIAVVSTGFSIHYFARMMSLAESAEGPRADSDIDSPPIRVYEINPLRPSRRRKRKDP